METSTGGDHALNTSIVLLGETIEDRHLKVVVRHPHLPSAVVLNSL